MNISYSQVEAQCNELHSVAKNMKEILDNIDGIRTIGKEKGIIYAIDVYVRDLEYIINFVIHLFC